MSRPAYYVVATLATHDRPTIRSERVSRPFASRAAAIRAAVEFAEDLPENPDDLYLERVVIVAAYLERVLFDARRAR